MKTAVFKNHHSNTVLQLDRDEAQVTFVAYVDGVVDVHKLPRKEFDREYDNHLSDYPVKRAAELYLHPLTTAIEVTERARKHLQTIINHEENTMSTIESSTAEGAKNTKETVKASLKTGTKAGKAPTAPAKKAAPKAEKPSTKGGAAKVVKGKKADAKPAKKAAPAKKVTRESFASKGDSIIRAAAGADPRGGATKLLFDIVAAAGKKGITREEAVAACAKKDKEPNAEKRARNNISWGLRHGLYTGE